MKSKNFLLSTFIFCLLNYDLPVTCDASSSIQWSTFNKAPRPQLSDLQKKSNLNQHSNRNDEISSNPTYIGKDTFKIVKSSVPQGPDLDPDVLSKRIGMASIDRSERIRYADQLRNLHSNERRKSTAYEHIRRLSNDLNEEVDNDLLEAVLSDDLKNPFGDSSQNNNNFGIQLPPSFAPNSPKRGFFENPQPPAPPLPPGPPSPTVIGPQGDIQVEDIKCLDFGRPQTFEAVLTLNNGYNAVLVFENRPFVNPMSSTKCRMVNTAMTGVFQLIISDYEECGVRKCVQSNGETWNCLVLRFPRIAGLKLPEDELIEIRCRPHDRTTDDTHVLSIATTKYADKNGIYKPATVFEGLQEFECEIGLFRQLPGTQQFNTKVDEDAPLELGEKVQLWSIIKEGDGWQYSRLSEVVIQKQSSSDDDRNSLNTVVLVFSDGCRNPNYKIIAENHPVRDATNNLVNKFTFRAFMFQDMEPGESLFITAKVQGCLMEEDCKPAVCPDDSGFGYGKRRKRRQVDESAKVKEFEVTTKVTKVDGDVVITETVDYGSNPNLEVDAESESSHTGSKTSSPNNNSPISSVENSELDQNSEENSYIISNKNAEHTESEKLKDIRSSEGPESDPTQSRLRSHAARKEGRVTDWSRNMAIRIKMPDDIRKEKTIGSFKECKLYIFISLGVSAVVCILSVAFASYSLCKNKRSKKEIPESVRSRGSVERVNNTMLSTEARLGVRNLKTDSDASTYLESDTTLDINSDSSSDSSEMQKIEVPPTIKMKKKKVNAELMELFNKNGMIPYNGGLPHPALLNYYGYMVVPCPQTMSAGQKRTVRALKRNAGAKKEVQNENFKFNNEDGNNFSQNNQNNQHFNPNFQQNNQNYHYRNSSSAKEDQQKFGNSSDLNFDDKNFNKFRNYESDNFQNTNYNNFDKSEFSHSHKSVINISAEPPTISHSNLKTRRPRGTRSDKYGVVEDTLPTMV